VYAPAQGETYASSAFRDDPQFDRPLDRVVRELGFRSGCALPLFVGGRPAGCLCVSSTAEYVDWARTLDLLGSVSAPLAAALTTATVVQRPGRVLICHEDELSAHGLARIIELSLGAEVAVCATREDALALVARPEGWPNAVICGTYFSGTPVDSFLAELRRGGCIAPVVVVAADDSAIARTVAGRSGAVAYVARSDGADRIVEATSNVLVGRSGAELEAMAGMAGDRQLALDGLTGQEAKVLVLLERGLRFKQIAARLGIAETTAKGYARQLFAKLDVHSRAEAVYEARRSGLLEHLRRERPDD
jgi:DNA-binding NarL/FixJ family response regulator